MLLVILLAPLRSFAEKVHLPYTYSCLYPLTWKRSLKILIGKIVTAGVTNLLIFLLWFLIPQGVGAPGGLPVSGLVEMRGSALLLAPAAAQ